MSDSTISKKGRYWLQGIQAQDGARLTGLSTPMVAKLIPPRDLVVSSVQHIQDYHGTRISTLTAFWFEICSF